VKVWKGINFEFNTYEYFRRGEKRLSAALVLLSARNPYIPNPPISCAKTRMTSRTRPTCDGVLQNRLSSKFDSELTAFLKGQIWYKVQIVSTQQTISVSLRNRISLVS